MTPTELLEKMRGLHEPGVETVVPQVGLDRWSLVGAVLAIAAIGFASWWRAHSWRRQARRELRSIARVASKGQSRLAWQRLSVLLRSVVLHVRPGPETANVVGEHWLALLDQTLGIECFVSGPGRAIIASPYQARDDHQPELVRVVESVMAALPGLRVVDADSDSRNETGLDKAASQLP
ncbi:MAG: DUF4381 domain-containing protein [Burkholderiaceae bacterium]